MMRWRAAVAAIGSAATLRLQPMLFLRTPGGGRIGHRACLLGTLSGRGSSGQQQARGPSASGTKQPLRLSSTVERMRLLRAQARSGEGEGGGQGVSQNQGAAVAAAACPAQKHEATIMAWLRSVVVGLKLCPWAAPALNAGAIRVRVHNDEDLEALTQMVLEEALALAAMPEAGGNATVLIGAPHALDDFDDFLQLTSVVEGLIDDLRLRGKVQLASFHPQYTFADSTPETDVENFTNRSPMPVLHLLREIEVSRALAAYPGDPDNIYIRNKAVMREMGKRQLQALVDACRTPPADSGGSTADGPADRGTR